MWKMYVGVGASRVRDLFKTGSADGTMYHFIDEIDAIGKSRDKSDGRQTMNVKQTLNQLLAEMDGFESK